AALQSVLASTSAAGTLDPTASQQTLLALTDRTLPKLAVSPPSEGSVHAALVALETFRPDAELIALLARVTDKELEDTLRRARDNTVALDVALKPVSQAIDLIERQLMRPETDAALRRNFVAARVDYNARRYDAEARLNQAVASLYELQVRKSNLSAERHHHRSQKF